MMLEHRIAQLDERLANARVINPKDIDTSVVSVGSLVRLRDVDAKETVEYFIVGSAEANPAERKLSIDRPVLIGHSLGAVIAYSAAVSAPELFGGVVAVDGVPFLPALLDPSATSESVKPQAAGMRRFYAAMSREQVEAGARAAGARMVRDPAQLDRIVAWTGRSDPATLGQALYDVMTTDLRAAVAGVRVPTLLVAAGADAPDAGARATILASYEAQVRAIPDHRVVLAEKARHFVMLDDPEFLYREVDGFLAALSRRPRTEGTKKK